MVLRNFMDGVEIGVQRLLCAGGNEANERSDVSLVGRIQVLIVKMTILFRYYHWWESTLHQYPCNRQTLINPKPRNELINMRDYNK